MGLFGNAFQGVKEESLVEVKQETSQNSQVIQETLITPDTVQNNQENKPKIHKDMTIGECVRLYPDTVAVMLENGIHCVGCHVAFWETIEQGFRGHYGMNEEKLTDFIAQLNYVVENNLKMEMKQ